MLTRTRRIEVGRSTRRAALAVAAFAALALGAIAPAAAGSLTPPGAPAPTMLSLDTVEPRTPISAVPFTINAGGSFYFTKNLSYSGAGGAIGINTSAPVTIDLNGFTLSGTDAAGTVGIVYSSIMLTKVTIKNGTIRDFDGGIALQIAFSDTHLDNLTVESNFGQGVFLWDATVTRCQFVQNGQWGMLANNTAIVTDSRALNNATWGFYLGQRSIITNSVADGNGPSTVDGGGITLAPHATARNNSVMNNHGNGITIYDHCLVVGNHVTGNDFNGIYALGGSPGGSRVESNSVELNAGMGINLITDYNVAIRNTLTGNTGGTIVSGFPSVYPTETLGANNPNSNILY